jgi:hypothetical protein
VNRNRNAQSIGNTNNGFHPSSTWQVNKKPGSPTEGRVVGILLDGRSAIGCNVP